MRQLKQRGLFKKVGFKTRFKNGQSVFLMSGGREFQRRGAVQLKALEPMVDRQADGTVREMDEANLRVQLGV